MFKEIRRERTRVLPLRWAANLSEIPASYLLSRALTRYYQNDEPEDFDGWDIRIANFIYNKFVHRWGTYYELVRDDCPGFQDALGLPLRRHDSVRPPQLP